MTILGFAHPFQKSSTAFPAQATDDDVIRNNIIRILSTPRGSRVMRPNQGSDVWTFVFENRGPLLRARINEEVRRAIGVGEPRVTVLQVLVTEETTRTGQELIMVDVLYRVNGNVTSTAVPYVVPG